MDKLRKQHEAVLIGTFAVLGPWYYYFYYHYHLGERPNFELFAALGLTVSGLAYLPQFLYEKLGWKIFNRELDFDGCWLFVETQNALDDSGTDFLPKYQAWGRMRIKQSVDSIAVVEGQTVTDRDGLEDLMCTWASKACDLNESGDIVAALEHKPSPKTKGGNVKYGIEIFTVTMRSDRFFRKERPIEMSSIVYHCIEKLNAAHQVEVKYVRLPKALEAEHISSKKIQRLLDGLRPRERRGTHIE